MVVRRVGDLDIAEDVAFQRRAWAVQRAGWGAMALLVLAALAGLLGGGGPLGTGEAGEADGPLRVRYARFARYQAPTELELELGPAAVRGGEARVRLSREYLEGVEVTGTSPAPAAEEAGPEGVTYVFRVSPPAPGRPATVVFFLETTRFGLRTAAVAPTGGEPVTFRQLVYP